MKAAAMQPEDRYAGAG
ncbi:hypothetical protein ACS0PU_012427 [Formica fusca]